MTNDQRAQRLEELAADKQARAEQWLTGIACDVALADAALLRECAAMWRERGVVQWHSKGHEPTRSIAIHAGRFLIVFGQAGHVCCWSASRLYEERSIEVFDTAETVPAAQAAAVAWCDGQEGK